jgi:hypothetical protein
VTAFSEILEHRSNLTTIMVGETIAGHDAGTFSPSDCSEALVQYCLTTLPAFNGLKRLLGQAGGILLLRELAISSDGVGGDLLRLAVKRFRDVRDALLSRTVPPFAAAHGAKLEEALALIGSVLETLEDNVGRSEPLLIQLSLARKCLIDASDNRFGMTLLDFRQGCCCGHASVKPTST